MSPINDSSDAVTDPLRARVLEVLFTGTTEEQRHDLQAYLDDIEQKKINAADARKILQEFLSEVEASLSKGREGRWKQTNEILQSPPFYFFFGCVTLILAFISSQAVLNSSLTFLVAMLGVAIILYGTGSQAAGTFGQQPAVPARLLQKSGSAPPDSGAPVDSAPADKPQQTSNPAATPAGYSPAAANLAVAGGAAVLTAVFGWGVIHFQKDIRQVFRDYDQYTRIRIEFCDIAVEKCADPDARPIAGSSFAKATGSSLQEDTLKKILSGTSLETALGERAYAKVDAKGLEFIVFDRDLGESGLIRLDGATAKQGLDQYAAANAYFSFRHQVEDSKGWLSSAREWLAQTDGTLATTGAPAQTVLDNRCLIRLSPDSCLFVRAALDAVDVNRVPRVVIRAVLRSEPLPRTDTLHTTNPLPGTEVMPRIDDERVAPL